jgi:hypothetical protein
VYALHAAAAKVRSCTPLCGRPSHTGARVFVAVVAVLLLHLVGAVIFSHLEDWTYSEAFYFCFVSLSTIGFGDFVPATAKGRAAAFVFIFFGVGFMAFVITAGRLRAFTVIACNHVIICCYCMQL